MAKTVNRGTYNPRFKYDDFDPTHSEDKDLFWRNMHRYHRERVPPDTDADKQIAERAVMRHSR